MDEMVRNMAMLKVIVIIFDILTALVYIGFIIWLIIDRRK